MAERGFKETPIGKIPEDWEAVKLGDISENKGTYRANTEKPMTEEHIVKKSAKEVRLEI